MTMKCTEHTDGERSFCKHPHSVAQSRVGNALFPDGGCLLIGFSLTLLSCLLIREREPVKPGLCSGFPEQVLK